MLHPRIFGLCLATAVLIACSDSPNQPSAPPVEGTYSATAFTVETPDTIFDLLAEGVRLTITLNANGTMTGSQSTADTVVDLTGQWDTSADTVRLHPANTGLLTLTPFVISPNRLQGDPVINSFAFHITLTKQAGR